MHTLRNGVVAAAASLTLMLAGAVPAGASSVEPDRGDRAPDAVEGTAPETRDWFCVPGLNDLDPYCIEFMVDCWKLGTQFTPFPVWFIVTCLDTNTGHQVDPDLPWPHLPPIP